MRSSTGGVGAWIRYGNPLEPGELDFAIAHYRAAILQPWETEAAARLKEARPDMTVLAYRCLSSTRDFEPDSMRASGLSYREARRRGWLARRDNGDLVEWNTYPGHFQARVWDPDYRARWVEEVCQATAETAFDGVMADNDVFDDYYGLDLPLDGIADTAALRAGDARALAGSLHNDLQAAALDLRPELAEVIAVAEEAGALRAIVSGSGPTIAALVEDPGSAQRVSRALKASGRVADVLRADAPVAGARVVG